MQAHARYALKIKLLLVTPVSFTYLCLNLNFVLIWEFNFAGLLWPSALSASAHTSSSIVGLHSAKIEWAVK